MIVVIIDNSDKIWFNAKQLIYAIGYKDAKDALRTHVSTKDKNFYTLTSSFFRIIKSAF